jgi:hypothetical protein
MLQYDLDLSVQTGLWATQVHNEGVLDRAFRTAQDVFLIFSVNKSGEFYGYARYVSVSPRIASLFLQNGRRRYTDADGIGWQDRFMASAGCRGRARPPVRRRATKGL